TDIGDDVVYALTKSVFENLAYLQHVDPILADLSLETALAGVVLPLHPGALRYYQETGLIPTPAASNTPSTPAGTPLPGDDDTPLKFPTEHYPDEDVAAAGRPGIGGPLLPAAPDDDDVDTESTVPPAETLQRQPKGNWWTPPSHWRRRAML
ncbi:MAG: TAXI family TRAP transporter solute-binding subunit, partial [Pseudomonadota bacterium]